MNKLKRGLSCPKCGFSATAEVSRKKYRFLLFECPVCSSNVAVYAGRTSVISDELVDNLKACGYLRSCGEFVEGGGISETDLVRLKNLLDSEQDFDRILSQL